MNKHLYVKINDLSMSADSVANMKIELLLNSNSSNKQTLTFPFDEFRLYEITDRYTDNILTITYNICINSIYYQVNKYELKMSPKFISKEIEKCLNINFDIEKPTVLLIDKSVMKLTVNSNITLLLVEENSRREKLFLDKNKVLSKHKQDSIIIEETEHSNQTEEELKAINKIVTDRENSQIEILRNNSSLDLDQMNCVDCKRCNYLEKFIRAQQKDISSLQNQNQTDYVGLNLKSQPSEITLKTEPIFHVINAGSNKNIRCSSLDDNGYLPPNKINSARKSNRNTSTHSLIPNKSKIMTNQSSSASLVNLGANPSNKLLHKSTEEAGFYILDNFSGSDGKNRNRNFQNEQKQTIDNLKLQIISLDKKSKSLEFLKMENETIKNQLSKSETLRSDIQNQYVNSNYNFQKKIENSLLDLEKIRKEKISYAEKSSKFEIENLNLKNEVGRLMNKLKEMEENLRLNTSNVDVVSNFTNTQTIFKEFIKNAKTKINSTDNFNLQIKEFKTKLDELRTENLKLFTENKSLNTKLQEAEQTLLKRITESGEKQKKISELESNVMILKNEQYNYEEVANHRNELAGKFSRIMEINFNLNEDITNLNKSYKDKISTLAERSKNLEDQNERLKKLILQKNKEVYETETKNEDSLITIQKLNLQITDLNDKLLYAKKIDENNHHLTETMKKVSEFNTKIINEINEFADYIITSADSNLNAQTYIQNLMKNVKEKEKDLQEFTKILKTSQNLQNSTENQEIYFSRYNTRSVSPNKSLSNLVR